MYEIRKWVIRPVLKEVIESNINAQALEETLGDILENNENITESNFFDFYEIEDLETGLMNDDVLINL